MGIRSILWILAILRVVYGVMRSIYVYSLYLKHLNLYIFNFMSVLSSFKSFQHYALFCAVDSYI